MQCSAKRYQKVNSSIVSKSAMNGFKEMFPLALMHTPPILFIFVRLLERVRVLTNKH